MNQQKKEAKKIYNHQYHLRKTKLLYKYVRDNEEQVDCDYLENTRKRSELTTVIRNDILTCRQMVLCLKEQIIQARLDYDDCAYEIEGKKVIDDCQIIIDLNKNIKKYKKVISKLHIELRERMTDELILKKHKERK